MSMFVLLAKFKIYRPDESLFLDNVPGLFDKGLLRQPEFFHNAGRRASFGRPGLAILGTGPHCVQLPL